MTNGLTKDEKIAIGQQLVTLTNRINAQGIIIDRLENDIELRDKVIISLKNDITQIKGDIGDLYEDDPLDKLTQEVAWIKMFIKGLPQVVESDT